MFVIKSTIKILSILILIVWPHQLSIQIENRVLNGIAAKLGQFPFAVRIVNIELNSHCSGSIISSQNVLTAAHCYNEVKIDEEHLGYCLAGDVLNRKQKGHPKSRQWRKVVRFVVHPKFTVSVRYDVAVLTVKKAFRMSSNVASISFFDGKPKDGSTYLAIGFGRQTYEPKDASEATLAWGRLTYQGSWTWCSADPGIMCLWDATKFISPGDSGGALADNNLKLVGVICTFRRYGKEGDPLAIKNVSVATSIHYHKEWIKEHMTETDERTGNMGNEPSMYSLIFQTLLIWSIHMISIDG